MVEQSTMQNGDECESNLTVKNIIHKKSELLQSISREVKSRRRLWKPVDSGESCIVKTMGHPSGLLTPSPDVKPEAM